MKNKKSIKKSLKVTKVLKVSPSQISIAAKLFARVGNWVPNIILLRCLFGIGLVLALISWGFHGFAMMSNDRFVWNHTFSSYDGVPVKQSYSGIMDVSTNRETDPQLNKSITGKPLSVAGQTFQEGIGTFSPSKIIFNLNGSIKQFSCLVGIEGSSDDGCVSVFRIFADGKKIYESPPMLKKMDPQIVDLDVSGKKDLCLEADPYNFGLLPDCADWLNLKFDHE